MLKLENNNISLTRGDSAEIQLKLTKNDEDFTPGANDTIKFSVSNRYKGQNDYRLIISKTVDNSLIIYLTPEDTKKLDYKTYNYDIEITYESGAVDTFVSGKFIVTGEVG